MANRRASRRTIARELVLALVITAGTLTLAEGGARLLHLQSAYFFIPTPANCLRRSTTLGMELRPRCNTTWTDARLTGAKGTTFATNSLGLRDAELADDDAIRILALGDSCTFGWQVAQDAAYPQVLQRLLDQRLGRSRYRVINAGVAGYTSYQGLVYLRERGLSLQPRIVIIGFGFNDGLPRGDVERDIARQHRLFLPMEIDDFLLTRSTLWRWARSQLRGGVSDEPPRVMPADPPADSGSPPGPPFGEPPPPSPLARVPPERFKRNLLQIVALVREHAAHAVLLSFSHDALQTRDPYAVAIREISKERQLPLLVYAGPRLDIVHPTAEGYAWLADQLLARLTAEGWVGRSPEFRGRAGTRSSMG